jgi:uncharacterized damage-inducible protein DinB
MAAAHLQTLRAMAYNNAWANHRLLAACAGLTQAEFEAPRTGFFPSIQATLNHILIVDRFYVDALEGGTLGPAAWADPIPCPTVADLRPAQAVIDRRLIAWCEALDEAGPDRIIRVRHARADGADRPPAATPFPAPDPSSRPGARNAQQHCRTAAAARRVLLGGRGAAARCRVRRAWMDRGDNLAGIGSFNGISGDPSKSDDPVRPARSHWTSRNSSMPYFEPQ